MAELDWFFSTLAQSTAAIAGFIITFTAVLYQLERQRREKRTEQLRDGLIELKETYFPVLRAMHGHLTVNFGPILLEEDAIRNLSCQELEDKAKDDFPERWAIILWVFHLEIILYYFRELRSSSNLLEHFLLTEEEFADLEKSMKWCSSNLSGHSEFTRPLELQLAERFDEDTVQGIENGKRLYFDDIFEYDAYVKGSLSDDNDYIRKWMADNSVPLNFAWKDYSGKDMLSFYTILSELKRNYDRVTARKHSTLLNYTPEVRDIMVKSGLLLLAGVFFPMVFLLPSINAGTFAKMGGYHLVAIEVFMIVSCGALTASLLKSIYESLHYRG